MISRSARPTPALVAALLALWGLASSARGQPRAAPRGPEGGVTVRGQPRNDGCWVDPSVRLGAHHLPAEATVPLLAERFDWLPLRAEEARARAAGPDLHVPRARIPMPDEADARARLEWVARRRMRAPMASVAAWIGDRSDNEWWRVRARAGVVGQRAVVSARFESRRPLPVIGMVREDLVLDALQCPVHYPVSGTAGPASCEGRRVMVTIANADSRVAMFVRAFVLDFCFAGPPRADGSVAVVLRPYVVRGEVRALPGVEQDDFDGSRDRLFESLQERLLGGLAREARLHTRPAREERTDGTDAESEEDGGGRDESGDAGGESGHAGRESGDAGGESGHAGGESGDAARAPAPPPAVCAEAIRGATRAYLGLVHRVTPGAGSDAFGATDAALVALWSRAAPAARDTLTRFAELDQTGRERAYVWIDATLEGAARALNDHDPCAHDLAYGHDRGDAGPRCAGETWSYYRPLVRWPPAVDHAHTATLALCRVDVARDDYAQLGARGERHRRSWYRTAVERRPWNAAHACSVLELLPVPRVRHEGAASTLAEAGQPRLGVLRVRLDARAGFTPYARFVTRVLRVRGLAGCAAAVRPLAWPDAPRRAARARGSTAPPR